jgi:hypothetical protein
MPRTPDTLQNKWGSTRAHACSDRRLAGRIVVETMRWSGTARSD